MRVVIVGAGEVGYHVIDALYREGVEIVAVDTSPQVLETLRTEYNVHTVQGNAVDIAVLEGAELEKADLFLAVTNYDETNIIACLMAGEAGVPKKIARVRTIDFGREQAYSEQGYMGIDLIINPYEVAAEHLTNLVRYPQLTDYIPFLQGRVLLVRAPISPGSPLAETTVLYFGQHARIPETLIGLVQRGGQSWIPEAEDVIHAGDQVYFICEATQLRRLFRYLELPWRAAKRVFINGGGHIGYALARRLEQLQVDVRILEIDERRCNLLSQLLDHALILNADGTDSNALKAEGVERADHFISITADDQVNIVSALLAKEYGAAHTVALVKQPEFIPILMERSTVDVGFSPRYLTARKLLRFVRGQNLDSFFAFPNSDIELLELRIQHGMPCDGRPLSSLELPAGVLVGAVKRGPHIFVPRGHDALQAGDIILLIQQRRHRRITNAFFLGAHHPAVAGTAPAPASAAPGS